MWLNYASNKPHGQLAVIGLIVIAYSSRYWVLGVEKGAHSFADILDLAFSLQGLNATTVPELEETRTYLVRNSVENKTYFLLHVGCTSVAWFLMPLQIWGWFRNSSSLQRHRYIGYVALAFLAVGMWSSLAIARPMRERERLGGLTFEVGLYGMAMATSFCAAMGLLKAKQGCLEEHRAWMVRCYGTIWGAFFWFRIAMAAILPLMPDHFRHGTGLLSNLSWMSGWIGADIALSFYPYRPDTRKSESKMD